MNVEFIAFLARIKFLLLQWGKRCQMPLKDYYLYLMILYGLAFLVPKFAWQQDLDQFFMLKIQESYSSLSLSLTEYLTKYFKCIYLFIYFSRITNSIMVIIINKHMIRLLKAVSTEAPSFLVGFLIHKAVLVRHCSIFSYYYNQ